MRRVLRLRLGDQVLELADLVARSSLPVWSSRLIQNRVPSTAVAQPVAAGRRVGEPDARRLGIEQLLEHAEKNVRPRRVLIET